MSDASSFFRRVEPLTVGAIARMIHGSVRDGTDLERRISNIAALDLAGPRDLAFHDKQGMLGALRLTRAGVCLVAKPFVADVPAAVGAVIVDHPYRAFVDAAGRLFPEALRPAPVFSLGEFADAARVHSSANIESGATIEPGAIIGPEVEIGSGSVIGVNAAIGRGVRIGRDCSIGACASIAHALIGDRVFVHAGCRIGQDGFGFLPGATHQKIPQVRRVIIQDDVEIGANSTIDRGGIRDTVIGEGSKIDNLVQIAHNVSIGRNCIIAAQCGISGSAVMEDFVVLAGQVGLADHVRIGSGAMIGAQSGVMNDVPAGQRWLGSPAMRAIEFLRQILMLRRLAAKGGAVSAGGADGAKVRGDGFDDERHG
ncbi:MAG: UDP-3-O-(3-hydroxymyristoyl)glucosamine N-acyltransferase [Proteobacteria bacterium]|nr:UDP-3-O-(3-hydroxymyristoyl)glucosamine N-acyltransferase [Pseudomonadota bacterium]